MALRALASSTLVLAIATLGSACQAYPNCGAFEFGDLQLPPTLDDNDANPLDCGWFRVAGTVNAPVVDDPTALDCALENIAGGHAMQVELDQEPDDGWRRLLAIFSDEDGRALRWRSVDEGLVIELEARVYELDTGRVGACRDLGDTGERFDCLVESFEADERVRTCETKRIRPW